MTTKRPNITIEFIPNGDAVTTKLASSTGLERTKLEDMKIGDRIKAYFTPTGNADDFIITFDADEAISGIENAKGSKFTDDKHKFNMRNGFDWPWNLKDPSSYEGDVNVNMGFYAYKIDTGLLMAKLVAGRRSAENLNKLNIYSGDGWRLPGPRELDYFASDLNGTIDPTRNPWQITYSSQNRSVYWHQTSHRTPVEYEWAGNKVALTTHNAEYAGWSGTSPWDGVTTNMFVYQYVDNDKSTNIYY